MPKKDILERLKETGALMEGHFLLSSGLHSDKYVQCAKLLQHPHHATWCAEQLVDMLPEMDWDLVISPAIGGIVIGQEVARELGVRHVFAEKVDSVPTLRRNFRIFEGDSVLLVEDVVTTGLSSNEVVKLVTEEGGNVTAACAIIDRGGGKNLKVPFKALAKLQFEIWEPEKCPKCMEGIPFIKPGSRKQKEE